MSDRFWRDEIIQPALDRDVEVAIAEQKAILERDPQNANAYFALGTFAHFKGNAEAAIPLFLRAIELDARFAAPHLSLGRVYAVRGNYDRAWKHAREAERLGNRELVDLLERYPNLK
jgi:tetratricopeptide (TPR) repeat protein